MIRRLRRSTAALLIGGLGLAGWAALRLIWNSSELVIAKTSGVNVFESRTGGASPTPTPKVLPTPSPQATPSPVYPTPNPTPFANSDVVFTLADNSVNQHIFTIEGFRASQWLTADTVQTVATSAVKPVYVSPDTPAQLPDTREEVKLFYPKEMSYEGSESFVIRLRNRAGAPIAPGANVAGYESKSFPADDIKTAPDTKAYASATLSAANFETRAVSVEWQSLDESKLEWKWNIAAKHKGRQRVDAAVRIQLRDKEGKVLYEKPTWTGDANVEVYGSWWDKDSINIFSLLQLLFGAGLTVPWFYDRIKKKEDQSPPKEQAGSIQKNPSVRSKKRGARRRRR